MIIPNGYAQVNFIYGGQGLPNGAEMTLGLDVTGYPGTPAELAEEIVEAYNASDLPDLQVGAVIFTGVLVKYGPNATGPSAEFATDTPGLGAGEGVTANTAVLIQKQTAFGGRAGRGRMYFPGVSEAALEESGVLSGTGATVIKDAWDAFIAVVVLAGVAPVLLHGAGSPITTPTPITGFNVAPVAATQRRRMRR